MKVGNFDYALVQVGQHWYLQSQEQEQATGPSASVACTPAELTDADNQVATCTVTLSDASTTALRVNLAVPAASQRYTTTCTSPIVIAANATEAACTITAVANTTPNDGDVTAELAVAAPTLPDSYTAAGSPALVLIKDDDTPGPVTAPHAVPTLGTLGLVAMASLMGLIGLRRSRKQHPKN